MDDRRVDLLVTDISYQSLYRATGPCQYQDVTAHSGVKAVMNGAESWGAGAAAAASGLPRTWGHRARP